MPPDREAGPPTTEDPSNAEGSPTDTSTTDCNGAGRHEPNQTHEWLPQLRRRRQAADRLPPLRCGHRDPWPCRCNLYRRHDNSDRWVDAGAAAARHLIECGLPPSFDLETLRAMWRQGHHQVAQQCRDAYGLAS
jgi:hypothetical protein